SLSFPPDERFESASRALGLPLDHPTLPYLLVFVFLAFACLWGLTQVPLTETDEGFAATRAESFYRHGSALLSYDGVDEDGPQFRKPPLLYWCVAALYPALGRTLYAVRLPTAVASFLLFLTLFWLVRQYLGEWCAFWGALLPVTVPFILLHVRTAMLDLPLLFLVFLSLALFSDSRRGSSRAVLAGLLAGSAILLKGAAGFIALGAPLLFALVTQGASMRWLRDAVIAALIALGCVAAYFLALPPPYQAPWAAGIFWHESVGRLVPHYSIFDRLHYLAQPVLEDLRWHVLAALFCLPLLVREAIRDRRVRAWVVLALIVSAPFVIGGLKLPASFPRYFLVVELLLLTLTPFFALRVLDSPIATLLLLPFALLCFQLERSGRQWLPTLSALGVFCLANLPALRERALSRTALATVLVLAITLPSHFSAAAALRSLDIQRTFPEVVPLAEKAAALVPPEEKLVVGWGFTNHTILFHSRRSLETFRHWLLSSLEPGAIRYGIFRDGAEPEGIPGVDTEVVDSSPPWRLVRLRVAPEIKPGTAILIRRHGESSARIEETLRLLDVEFERFPKGFVLPRASERAEVAVGAGHLFVDSPDLAAPGVLGPGAAEALVIGKGHDLHVPLEHEVSVSGLDLFPSSKAEEMSGLRIEAKDPQTGDWREVKVVDRPFDPSLGSSGGRVVRTSGWA
ncbi:MAG: ArnT family glycosyltransferase, partial [Candidatus Binatia bacterium]